MAIPANGLYKAEVIHRRSWPRMEDVELTTLAWVDWYNHRRLISSNDYRTPAQSEADYYQPKSALREAA